MRSKPLSFISVALLIVVLFSVVSCGPESSQTTPATVELGSEAPDFTLTDLSGESVSLSEFRGKVVLLNFWATWCPPCKAEMPSMEKLFQTLKEDGFVLLTINIEPNGRQTVPEFLAQNPHSFPVLFDVQGSVHKRYGVFKFPESFVIRKDGVIDDKVVGAIDWSHPEVIAYFRSLLKG
jgi:peroxiredoxin